jgi:hypothetical protein
MEILGLLDTLEATIMDGFKIPMTKKTIVNEEQVLILIDKMRMVAKGGSAKDRIDQERGRGVQGEQPARSAAPESDLPPEIMSSPDKASSAEMIQQAYQIAKEIREGADKYADEILSNLEQTSTRILRTINAGRDRLKKNVQVSAPEEKNAQKL